MEVSVCIPAWQAGAFIDRTLQCAREQTHEELRIIVSIDLCDDDTESVCKAHARADDRVEVHAQRARLGWARNVNFLLDRVETEFAFLYFHDDIIERSFTERLVGSLLEHPTAASAHCDMSHFGGSDKVNPGREYDGTTVERIMTFLVAPDRGSLLRSMMRATVLDDGLRMPTASNAGVWANEPFMMKLVAAGPARCVPEALYRRWDQRAGGLTDGWLALGVDEIVHGHRVNTESALEVIEGVDASREERDVLRFALFVYVMTRVRTAERKYDAPMRLQPEELHRAFTAMTPPPALDALPEQLRTWTRAAYERLLRNSA
jgi:hypothetical protein